MEPVYSVSVGERGQTTSISYYSFLLLIWSGRLCSIRNARAFGGRSCFKQRVGTLKGESPSSFLSQPSATCTTRLYVDSVTCFWPEYSTLQQVREIILHPPSASEITLLLVLQRDLSTLMQLTSRLCYNLSSESWHTASYYCGANSD